jgi:hypothetical protein
MRTSLQRIHATTKSSKRRFHFSLEPDFLVAISCSIAVWKLQIHNLLIQEWARDLPSLSLMQSYDHKVLSFSSGEILSFFLVVPDVSSKILVLVTAGVSMTIDLLAHLSASAPAVLEDAVQPGIRISNAQNELAVRIPAKILTEDPPRVFLEGVERVCTPRR